MRYILIPWTIFLVYSFFSFFLGQNGLYARRYLQTEKARLSENYKVLQATNDSFLKIKDMIMTDSDALSVYARQLGYGRNSEKVVRIMGLGIAVNSELPAGEVYYAETPSFVPDNVIKLISALFGFAILVFFVIYDFLLPKIRGES
jgi:cell division protein FtsB